MARVVEVGRTKRCRRNTCRGAENNDRRAGHIPLRKSAANDIRENLRGRGIALVHKVAADSVGVDRGGGGVVLHLEVPAHLISRTSSRRSHRRRGRTILEWQVAPDFCATSLVCARARGGFESCRSPPMVTPEPIENVPPLSICRLPPTETLLSERLPPLICRLPLMELLLFSASVPPVGVRFPVAPPSVKAQVWPAARVAATESAWVQLTVKVSETAVAAE
jgi:hypothetical protein